MISFIIRLTDAARVSSYTLRFRGGSGEISYLTGALDVDADTDEQFVQQETVGDNGWLAYVNTNPYEVK
ncbi:MAG: hypothetical protein WKF30_01545 [Pyrinomonadaceae bacterium]